MLKFCGEISTIVDLFRQEEILTVVEIFVERSSGRMLQFS